LNAVVSWPEKVDQVLAGDQAIALAHRTPALGVVLSPVTNFAVRDRDAGTVTVNSSVGMWRKLARIREDPLVALAFHTREHALSQRPEYVLVQGRASLSSLSEPDAWQALLGESWENFGGQPREVGRLWRRWLRAYHWRINIQIAVERIVVWPDLQCSGRPRVHGAPLPEDLPAPQRPPARGTGPRIDPGRAARRIRRLPNVLLGWVGADGLPIVVPVHVTGAQADGIHLEAPLDAVAPGGRRAGLLAHWFGRHVVGQRQRKHTGWLETTERGTVTYAPHTAHAYRLPPSRLAYNVGAGFVTRRGVREARAAGFLPDLARAER
jgi:hypothetical protein